MVPTTRRRFLSATVGCVAALAGCNESRTSSTTRSESRRPENVERDPETRVLRAPSDDPAAWLRREGRGDGETTDADDAETPPTGARKHGLVASAETVERLRVADVDGAEDARRFVDETDFGSETVYFETHSVGECYRLELCYVTWSAREIDTQYGSHYRDAEVDCEEGGEETTAWFIRIPDVLDPDGVTGRGSGWSSNGCHYPPYLRTTAEETTTDEVVAHPVTTNATDATTDTDTTAEDER